MFTNAAIVAGFAALVAAKPLAYPQQLDLDAIIAAGPPAPAVIPTTAGIITINPTSLASAAAAAITASPLPQTLNTEADTLQKRQETTSTSIALTGPTTVTLTTSTSTTSANACSARPAQPTGAGPIPSPDTASAFLAYSSLSSIALSAPTPSNYAQAFSNLQAENNAYGYMGYTLLDSYDTQACASKCDSIVGCQAINVAFERAPAVDPDYTTCTNPSSTTLIKCVFWGSPVTKENAVNNGQWRADFQVVVAGSNGYVSKNHVGGQTAPGYTLQADLDMATVNAPLDCNGNGSYMGYVSWNDGAPFSIARCAAACSAQTAYNQAHPPADGNFLSCRYFATYYLMKNGLVQAQVCSMYTQTIDTIYAVNTGYYYGSDVYTIASSVTFYNTTDPGTCVVGQGTF